MRTRIFYNHQTGEKFTLSEDEIAERRNRQDSAFVLKDIDAAYKDGGILSPVDGSWITSRAQLRRHNATHQCRQGGDFKPGEIISKGKARSDAIRMKAEGGKVSWR